MFNFLKNIFETKKSQPRILLVHGFGTSVYEEFIKLTSKGKVKFEDNAGDFKAFKQLISEEKAFIFKWNEEFEAKDLKDFVSVNKYIELYKKEKLKAATDELQLLFKNFIDQVQPEIIVCHSMGCYLMLNFLERHQLPENVKKIFFVQGDFDSKYQIQNENIKSRIENDTLRIINIYCPWDTTLVLSPLINKLTVPAGLGLMRNRYFVDVMFPLSDVVNLHNSSLKSKDLVEFVLKY